MMNQARVIAMAALLMAGCTDSSTPTADRTATRERVPGLKPVTFYVADMNERLQIL